MFRVTVFGPVVDGPVATMLVACHACFWSVGVSCSTEWNERLSLCVLHWGWLCNHVKCDHTVG